MGLNYDDAMASLRFSLGKCNTRVDIQKVIQTILKIKTISPNLVKV